MKPAAMYLRRSTDRQEQSIEDQRAEHFVYGESNGLHIVREYLDDAVSGTSVHGRTAFNQMIHDAQQSDCPFRCILVSDIKRFSRGDIDEPGYYRHILRDHDVEVIYINEGFAGNDSDDLVRSVKQYLARQESKDLSRVTIRGQLSSLKKGWWPGGKPPFGYDLQYFDSHGKPQLRVRLVGFGEKQILDINGNLTRTLAPRERVPKSETDKARLVLSVPGRVALVRRVFDMSVKQGMGFKSIARKLNDEGILPLATGKRSGNYRPGWSLSTIRDMTMNPLYTGDTVWNRARKGKFHYIVNGEAREFKGFSIRKEQSNDMTDWEIMPNTHLAIIDRETFDKAQRLRRERSLRRGGVSYRSGRAKNSPYLLTSLIRCVSCGHRYHGYTTNSTIRRKDGTKIKTLYYACGGAVAKGVCERILVRKDELEQHVLRYIKARIEGFLKTGGDKVLKRILADELKASYQDPATKRESLKEQLDEIDRMIDRLIESLTPTNKEFVDRKLVSLKRDRDRLGQELKEQKVVSCRSLDLAAVANEIIASMGTFEEVFQEGSLEERKEFVSFFVEKIELDAKRKTARMFVRRFPVPASLGLGKPSFGVRPLPPEPACNQLISIGLWCERAVRGALALRYPNNYPSALNEVKRFWSFVRRLRIWRRFSYGMR